MKRTDKDTALGASSLLVSTGEFLTGLEVSGTNFSRAGWAWTLLGSEWPGWVEGVQPSFSNLAGLPGV